MQWSRGLFRFWVLFSVLWCLGAVLVNYNSVVSPYISNDGYIFGSDTSKPPTYAEEFSPPYQDALALKASKKAVQYQIEKEGVLRKTAYFFPSTTSQEDAIKLFEAHFDTAAEKQGERVSLARRQNLLEALGGALLPPIGLLLLGLGIRWALKGFQKKLPQVK